MRKLWLSHFEPHMLQSLRLFSWSFYTLDHRKLCGPLAAWFWQPPNSGPPTLSFSRFLINRCKDRITFVKRRLLYDKPCPMISIIPFPQSHFLKKKKNVNPRKNHISCFGFFCRVNRCGAWSDDRDGPITLTHHPCVAIHATPLSHDTWKHQSWQLGPKAFPVRSANANASRHLNKSFPAEWKWFCSIHKLTNLNYPVPPAKASSLLSKCYLQRHLACINSHVKVKKEFLFF